MNICCNPECRDPDCSGLGGGHCSSCVPETCLFGRWRWMTAARTTDPSTSWKAARVNQSYRNKLRFNMLYVHYLGLQQVGPTYGFRGMQGFSNDEIAIHMDLDVPANGGTGKPCFWKRHSELVKDFGFCDVLIGADRIPPRGREPQQVQIINQAGVRHVQEVLYRFPNITKLDFY